MPAPGAERALAAPPDFELPDLRPLAGTLRCEVAESPARRTASVYYDTEDCRLLRFGAFLRERDDGGFTVGLPARAKGVLARRRRFHFARAGAARGGSAGAPGQSGVPAGARDLLTAYLRGAALVPAIRVAAVRRSVELRDARGACLLRVAHDDATAGTGGSPLRFGTLAIEPRDAAGAPLRDAVVEELCRAGAGPPDPPSEVARALCDRMPAPELELGELEPDAVVGQVVRRAIAASLSRVIHHDAGVRLGADAEDVHQARVGTRRLRSDLRTFRPFLDRAFAEELRAGLRGLAAALGEVRDTDVLLERLRAHAAELPARDRAAGERLLARLFVRRREARERLLSAMRERAYLDLLDTLVEAAHAPKLTGGAGAIGHAVLPAYVAARWRKLKRAVRRLGPRPTDADLHRVRVLAKRCRYAAEAVSPVAGRPARELAEALSAVQDVLGEHQDAIVAQRWLDEVAQRAPSPEAFVAGELVARERLAAAAAREAWPGIWRAASEKRLRKWW